MTYNLFLDDERMPNDVVWEKIPDHCIIARNYTHFKNLIEDMGIPKFVAFDHDLSDFQSAIGVQENLYTYNDGDMVKTFDYGSEKTGLDCAKFLIAHCQKNFTKFPEYVVHSMNPIGRKRIIDEIESYQKYGLV